MKTAVVAPAAALALALLVAACGGGSGDASTPPPPAPGSGANSIAQVKADARGSHEALPPGLSTTGPATGRKTAPSGTAAYGGYGELYVAGDNRAVNTRVELRNFETYVLRRSTGFWKRVQYSERVDGAAYTMNYAGVGVAAPLRNEAGGGVSIKPAAMTVFRFWPESGLSRSIVPPEEVAAVFTTVQARLIHDSAAAADDRALARMVVSTAADWRSDMTLYASPMPAPSAIGNGTPLGVGKLRLVRNDWRAVNFHTATDAQVDALDVVQEPAPGARRPLANSELPDVPRAWRAVMIGDAITEGNAAGSGLAGHDSYRRPLWNSIVADPSQPLIDFVGTRSGVMTIGGNCLSPVPASEGLPLLAEYDQDHEAYWGWCLDNVSAVLPDRLLRLDLEGDRLPDIALVHLGTGDLDQQAQSAAAVRLELQSLVGILRSANPRIRILLAQLIPMASGEPAKDARVAQLNTEIASLAQTLHTATSPITLVDQFQGFSGADRDDGFLPSVAGEQKMADRWLPALRDAVREALQ